MKIQIDGTNTVNKGAELMLYAILQEIQKKYPDAIVFFNSQNSSLKEVKSSLTLTQSWILKNGKYLRAILRRLGLPFQVFTEFNPFMKVDLVLDASGFRHSDQWKHSKEYLDRLTKYYQALKSRGTKIILLPQAFGPFNTENGKLSAQILNDYVDFVFAREQKSYEYLLEAGLSENKAVIYPDFSALVSVPLNLHYEELGSYVCVIPNKKMTTHTNMSEDEYVKKMAAIISAIKKEGKSVLLLNHEGAGDLSICNRISKEVDFSVEIASGFDALEVKGIIGNAYAVLSSRFHGVASALSQNVPCLATSWSHKYKLLFEDFGQNDRILDLNGSCDAVERTVIDFIAEDKQKRIKEELQEKSPFVKNKNREMWSAIWEMV